MGNANDSVCAVASTYHSGAQRFRLVPDVTPRNTKPLYRRGNLIIWDQEGTDRGKLQSDLRAAIAGGKSRRIPGFDYSEGGAVSTTYQPITRRRGPTATSCSTSSSLLPVSATPISKRCFLGT